MADGVDFLGFDRLISELEQMGLRGEKIEDRALAAGGEQIRKAIAERSEPRSSSLRNRPKVNPGVQANICLIIYGLQRREWKMV